MYCQKEIFFFGEELKNLKKIFLKCMILKMLQPLEAEPMH